MHNNRRFDINEITERRNSSNQFENTMSKINLTPKVFDNRAYDDSIMKEIE